MLGLEVKEPICFATSGQLRHGTWSVSRLASKVKAERLREGWDIGVYSSNGKWLSKDDDEGVRFAP